MSEINKKIKSLEEFIKLTNPIEEHYIKLFIENIKRNSPKDVIQQSYNSYHSIHRNCSVLHKNIHEDLFYLVKSIYDEYNILNNNGPDIK